MKLYELFERCLNITYTKLTNDADVAFERKGEHLFIYFEQTKNTADWKNNFDFPAACRCRKDDTLWFAHRGFLRVWESAAKHLDPILSDKTIKAVTVVGYSHGAALAVLCHEHLWFYRPDLRDHTDGYGFGCPRVIWGIPPKERWKNFTVIRIAGDIVTYLPPAALGYRHVGIMLEITKGGRYTTADAHRPENILKELKHIQ